MRRVLLVLIFFRLLFDQSEAYSAIFTVVKGDTLSQIIYDYSGLSIRKLYGENGLVRKIVKLNNLTKAGDYITVGMKISIPIKYAKLKFEFKSRPSSKKELVIKEIITTEKEIVEDKNKVLEKGKYQLDLALGASYYIFGTSGILGTSEISGGSINNFSGGLTFLTKDINFGVKYEFQKYEFNISSEINKIILKKIETEIMYKKNILKLSYRDFPLIKLNADLGLSFSENRSFIISAGRKKDFLFLNSILSFSLYGNIGFISSAGDPLINTSSYLLYGLEFQGELKRRIFSNWEVGFFNSLEYNKWSSNIKWDDRDGKYEGSALGYKVLAKIYYTF